VGTLSALAAMAAGFLDFLKLPHDHPAAEDIQKHSSWVAIAWCCYAASLFLRVQGGSFAAPQFAEIGLSVVGFGSLCVAGWLGGKLVYAHGVNVGR